MPNRRQTTRIPADILARMALEIVLDGVEFSSVEVTRFTTWRHAEVFDSQGASVVVEYSDPSDSERAASTIEQLLDQVRGKAVRDESVIVGLPGQEPADLGPRNPVTVAISALRTAVVELEAVHRGASLTETLGGTSQDSVELYANINRALLTEDRSASSFAAEAERAAARGFKTIKCAPFDEVVQPLSPDSAFQEARTGIDRVAAVREAVGPDVKVLVDCHRRFDVESAPRVAEALARLDVGWFEEPVDPMSDTEAHAQIAAQVRMPVAGGEGGYGGAVLRRSASPESCRRYHARHRIVRWRRRGATRRADDPSDGRRVFAAQPIGACIAAGRRPRHCRGARSDAARARGKRGRLAGGATRPTRAH